MHYIDNLVRPGVHSLADASRFFLAPDGKTNPRSELEATLASFFSDVQETDSVQNPQCEFIARFSWLDVQLGFDSQRMPRRECKRYRAWHEALDPGGVSLIFPTAYINNPSSMYGHTFLRIDTRNQTERTRLLSYAINYTANTDETNGIAFAINALYGVYPGKFSMMPYYLKVREYNDLENRDIWEYELDLTSDEIDRLLMHAWELGPVDFDYYFFDENCSYYVLELLQTARFDMDLTRDFRWWAIPSDTVRAVLGQEGLLERVSYRPSNATLIQHRLRLMSARERAFALKLARGEIAAQSADLNELPETERARVLEVGHDYLAYLQATGKTDAESSAGRSIELLKARSRIATQSHDASAPIPEVRPEQGHGTARLSLGTGRRDGIDFVELRARPSYHDLLDPEAGYARGAQIQFFDLSIRHYGEGRGLRLEEFRPVDIVSISSRNDYFRPLSWKVDAGWSRKRLSDGSEPLVAGVQGGAGFAWSIPDSYASTTTGYLFLEAGSQFHGKLDQNHALGFGPSAGVFIDLSSRWRAELFASARRFVSGENGTDWSVGMRQRYTLASDYALRLDLTRESQAQQFWNSALISLQLYF